MKNFTLLLLIFALFAGFSGCSSKQDNGAAAAKAAHASRLLVTEEGEVFLNDKPVAVGDLPARFAEIKAKGESLWYHRENSEGERHPNARLVLNALIEAQLPVQLYSDAAFTKPVTMDGVGPAPSR